MLTILEVCFAVLLAVGVFLLAGLGVALICTGVLGVIACEHLGRTR